MPVGKQMGQDMWRLWFTKLLLLLAAAFIFAAVETGSEGEFLLFFYFYPNVCHSDQSSRS